MIQFNYQVPIKESQTESKDFIIEGTAINATTTANGHTYLEEELKPSAHTLIGVPLLADHKNEIDSIKGRVIEGVYGNKKVTFSAKVTDKNAQAMIKDGRLNSVSVGAVVNSFDADDDGNHIARGITFRELSLVAVGADEGATFGIAMEEAFMLNKNSNITEVDDMNKEQLDLAVAKAVKEAFKKRDADIAETPTEVKGRKFVEGTSELGGGSMTMERE